jgi:hypothetical protein
MLAIEPVGDAAIGCSWGSEGEAGRRKGEGGRAQSAHDGAERGGDGVSRPTFAELLRLHRERQGLTLEKLAEASGTNVDTVSKLARGERRPRLSTAKLLA